MSVIVTDRGFQTDDWQQPFTDLRQIAANGDARTLAVDLQPDDDVAGIECHLDRVAMVRIAFPSFADGRGFTLARSLRQLGYQGRLRAFGHVLADQYAMARRSGFDEVEIDEALARRQPEDQWLRRADWRAHDYQSRLRA